ncbi:excalibur calcium-binding domain-containing protein [Microbacterium sp. JZ31]|uniref:excalibur calcium-binding domain-containing protein n=1 Tax=Microbacterium sp. JZ31 TaxID=1906274 RepID=UPI001932B26B|nr:excalibur calcium-binding domain-containing protein [Microbacterium sp. JZ31]
MSTKIGFRPLALACAAALIAMGAGATPAMAHAAESPAAPLGVVAPSAPSPVAQQTDPLPAAEIPATAGQVVVSGAAKVGSTLTAQASAWAEGAALSYQWLRDGTVIPGATSDTYTVVAPDLGRRLSVRVMGAPAGEEPVTVTSTDVVVAAGTLVAATPAISGSVRVGSTVKAATGTWTRGTTFSYQWYVNGAAIKGATKSSYALPAGYAGRALTVKVTGSLSGYTAVSKVSAGKSIAAGTLSGATPTISDTTPKVGQRISALPGSWTSGVTRKYQWYANGVAIKGATSHVLTVPAGAKGRVLTVKVTGSKSGYATLAKTSRDTAKVAPGTLSGSTPRISGTVKVGSKVTAVPGTWSSGVTRKYQWYANGAALRGATSHILRIPSSAAGKTLTVKVTGTKAGYSTLVKTSAGKAVPRPAAPRPATPAWTPRGDLDCGDFSSWTAAQSEFDRAMRAGYGDYHRLDADNDGVACESLR